jgi:hypothetical protein
MSTLQYLVRYIFIIGLYAYMWRVIRIVCMDIQHIGKGSLVDRRLVAIDPDGFATGEMNDYRFDTGISLERGSDGQVIVCSEVQNGREVVVFCRTNRCYVYVARGVKGVFLNGEKVDRLRPVRVGDIIEVDGAIFEYRE